MVFQYMKILKSFLFIHLVSENNGHLILTITLFLHDMIISKCL